MEEEKTHLGYQLFWQDLRQSTNMEGIKAPSSDTLQGQWWRKILPVGRNAGISHPAIYLKGQRAWPRQDWLQPLLRARWVRDQHGVLSLAPFSWRITQLTEGSDSTEPLPSWREWQSVLTGIADGLIAQSFCHYHRGWTYRVPYPRSPCFTGPCFWWRNPLPATPNLSSSSSWELLFLKIQQN